MVTGVGAMTWSPLACGIITGKYENGIPEASRASMKVGNITIKTAVFFEIQDIMMGVCSVPKREHQMFMFSLN